MGRHRRAAGVERLVAAALLLASGCGGTFLAADAFTPRDAEHLPPTPEPVADLSGDLYGVSRLFTGFSLGQAYPVDSSLEKGTTYDFSLAYDVASSLAVELVLGHWDLGDEPVPNAGSSLSTVPVLAMAQFQGEFGRTRFYVGAGAGYAFNDYETGYGHSQAAMSDLGISSYGVEVDNALLFQYGGGLEFYSTLDAKLNLGVDARFVSGEVDTTEQLGSTGSRESTRDVKLWLIRVGLTWHF